MRTWPTVFLLLACARSRPTIAETAPALTPPDVPAQPVSAERAAPKALPAAVVELFTSEGCSSCPAADENLASLTALAERSGQRLFGLELHVDYWNDLGWHDPFSAPAYSERQRVYAEAFGLRGIYTPQMVVNGREEFVGSHGRQASEAIARALAAPGIVAVAVKATRASSAKASIRVDYTVGPSEGVDLHLACAIDAAETRVTRGENANQLLKHRHVVLAFETLPISGPKSGSWLAAWPASATGVAAFVVAYVSDPRTLAVLGSDGITVPPAATP